MIEVIDIPCPVCGCQAGRVWESNGKYWCLHLICVDEPSVDSCRLDPVDARLVLWMLNNPDWDYVVEMGDDDND